MPAKKAVLISFSIKSAKFNSAYERNSFYRAVYGWKQIIIKKGARYEYHKEGLLNDIPNIKLDQSLFMITQKHLEEIERFFDEWHDKVLFNAFEVILNRDQAKKLSELVKKEASD